MMNKWLTWIEDFTAGYLTRRKRKKHIKKIKKKNKNVVLDWIEAFLWAAAVVLLINQYLLQAYLIPSGSMRNTLLENDRIFVNKLIFGPELLPGVLKLPFGKSLERSEIIIFENPTYQSKGPLFDIAQRVLYMLTFTLVDLDRDKQGNPLPHFLIKRAVIMDDEQVKFQKGEMYFKSSSSSEWISEKDYAPFVHYKYKTERLISPEAYPQYKQNSESHIWGPFYPGVDFSETGPESVEEGFDLFYQAYTIDYCRLALEADNPENMARYAKHETGLYVPPEHFLPLGDNRDNSRDGRWFGPVKKRKLLGRALLRYWPLFRFSFLHGLF